MEVPRIRAERQKRKHGRGGSRKSSCKGDGETGGQRESAIAPAVDPRRAQDSAGDGVRNQPRNSGCVGVRGWGSGSEEAVIVEAAPTQRWCYRRRGVTAIFRSVSWRAGPPVTGTAKIDTPYKKRHNRQGRTNRIIYKRSDDNNDDEDDDDYEE